MRHYHAAGVRVTRAELDAGLLPCHEHRLPGRRGGSSPQPARVGEIARRASVRPSPSPRARQRSRASRGLGKSVMTWPIGSRPVSPRSRPRVLRAAAALLKELSHDFKLGVVSNFYGNLQVVLFEAGIRELIQVAIDSKQCASSNPTSASSWPRSRCSICRTTRSRWWVTRCTRIVHLRASSACARSGCGRITLGAGEHPQAREAAALADHAIDTLEVS